MLEKSGNELSTDSTLKKVKKIIADLGEDIENEKSELAQLEAR